MWYLFVGLVCLMLGWFGKGYFGSLSEVEQAIVNEYRRFGKVSVTAPSTGTVVQAVPTAHSMSNT